MAKKLKAGVIGTGIIGKSHVRGYANMADDVEIVAVADLDKAEADRVAKEYNIPNVFTYLFIVFYNRINFSIFIIQHNYSSGVPCLFH